MSLPDEGASTAAPTYFPPTCARWEKIERALGAPGPVPADVRRELWDVAHLLNKAVQGDDLLVGQRRRLTPTQAAAHIPAVLGLTPSAIRAYREARHGENFGRFFELMRGLAKRGQIENLAKDMASSAKVTTRQIYRYSKRWRARSGN